MASHNIVILLQETSNFSRHPNKSKSMSLHSVSLFCETFKSLRFGRQGRNSSEVRLFSARFCQIFKTERSLCVFRVHKFSFTKLWKTSRFLVGSLGISHADKSNSLSGKKSASIVGGKEIPGLLFNDSDRIPPAFVGKDTGHLKYH